MGDSVVRHLILEGHQPRLLVRSRPNRPSNAPSGPTDFRVCDFASVSSISEALHGADALVHLVGIISECGASTFEAVHPELTQRVVQACRLAGVQRLIHMSALGTRPGALSRYHQTKWRSEEVVRRSGLSWTIFRPSLIYGARDQFTQFFARMSRWSPILPAIGGGHNRMQPIGIDCVAQAFARSVAHPASVGATYDLCGPERLTFRSILEMVLSASRRRRLILTVPFPVARIQARLLEFMWPRLLGKAPPLNRDQILMLQEDNVGDGGAADAAFGLVHAPFRDALEKMAR